MLVQKHYHWRHWGVLFIILGGMFTIGHSSFSGNMSQNAGCIREGSYKFVHYRSLEGEPACRFKGGNEVIQESGYTILAPTSDGFMLSAGNEQRWNIRAACTDESTTTARITLYNKCKQRYITTSQSTVTFGTDGEILINEYQIKLACGESMMCHAVESWSLAPEIW